MASQEAILVYNLHLSYQVVFNMNNQDRVSSINLVNATICFSIVSYSAPTFHYDVIVTPRFEFRNREQYLAFRRAWKQAYSRISRAIRILRPVPSSLGDSVGQVYFNGRYHFPNNSVASALFFYRMQAKALLAALKQAKVLAGEQWRQQHLTKSLNEQAGS